MNNQGTTAVNNKPASTEEHNNQILTRTLHVTITSSLGNLALAGPLGGLWKLVDGAQHKSFLNMEGDAMDTSSATSQLGSAIIHECTLLEHQSTFPVHLGVQINCVPSNAVTELGNRYAVTVLPCSSHSSHEELYKSQPLEPELYDWHKEYPNYNSCNLESEGVLSVNNQPTVFVDLAHPVCAVLRANAHLIGCDIDSQKKMNNQYVRISRQVLSTCCDTLRKKILNKTRTYDLNTFSVQIHRIDAENWEEMGDGSMAMQSLKLKAGISPEEEEEAKRKHLRRFVSTPYTYSCRLRLRYELPNQS